MAQLNIRYTLSEGGFLKPLRIGISERKLIAQLRDDRNHITKRRRHDEVTRSFLPAKADYYWVKLTTIRKGRFKINVHSVFFPDGRIWDSEFRSFRSHNPTVRDLNEQLRKIRADYHNKNLNDFDRKQWEAIKESGVDLTDNAVRTGLGMHQVRIETSGFVFNLIDPFYRNYPAPEFGPPVRIDLKPLTVQQRLEEIKPVVDDMMGDLIRRQLKSGGPERTFEGIIPFLHRTDQSPAFTVAPEAPDLTYDEFMGFMKDVFAPPKDGSVRAILPIKNHTEGEKEHGSE